MSGPEDKYPNQAHFRLTFGILYIFGHKPSVLKLKPLWEQGHESTTPPVWTYRGSKSHKEISDNELAKT